MSAGTDYLLPDGSPRYGVRTTGAGQDHAVVKPVRPFLGSPAALISEAEAMDAGHLHAAVKLRYSQEWADAPDPVLEAWRKEHPAELKEAEALVGKKLGKGGGSMALTSPWYLSALVLESRRNQPVRMRRRETRTGRGTRLANMLFRAAMLGALIGMIRSGGDPQVVVSMVLFYLLVSEPLAVSSRQSRRLPDTAAVPLTGLDELRGDLVNAVLLGIVLGKGIDVDPVIRAAAERGWRHVRHAADGVDRIRRGPK
ncbi:hypothetical protein [Arthrobacter sp. zg-Y1110]|uniref:hypothetical protein n=1 Tax=Arthrobacter sp. zg-Y1110 TaxID=2886932 RepID=UPI001D1453AD|nr:hypothetical protein [Arthrobacter sp. zg-Y1110]MCC3292493.1 hypothetical protein [Arthrobacter sp. zg-Y1110]UWX87075.1 hypothetical protein N2K99_17130 [Arthrobacter sp. zg-Y1110]